MNITPDQIVFWKGEFLKLNHTILSTWLVMAVIVGLAIILRILLTSEKKFGKLQNFFEILVIGIEDQISKMGKVEMKYVFPFIATLFIFILVANMLNIIPFFIAPTASLSTTVALTILVILIGITYGIKTVGFIGYLKKYSKPTIIMLPMNLISDIAGNCSLAIRLYGNMMSGMIITAVVAKVAFLALGFPIFLSILSFIAGIIQAYIFSILALVFILSAEE